MSAREARAPSSTYGRRHPSPGEDSKGIQLIRPLILTALLAGIVGLLGCGSDSNERPDRVEPGVDSPIANGPPVDSQERPATKAQTETEPDRDQNKPPPADSITQPPRPDPNVRYLRKVTQRLIPYEADRRRDMADYSHRHYGEAEWRLARPQTIVQHYAVAPTNDSIFNTFSSNNPDPSFGELPNVCTHYAIDDEGEVIQMVPLHVRCRHVVGLNHVSIGIEHTGYSDSEVLENPAQMEASLRLSHALRCRFKIPVEDVIGHNESLESRFFREDVPEFKNASSPDFSSDSMTKYRARLAKLGHCSASP